MEPAALAMSAICSIGTASRTTGSASTSWSSRGKAARKTWWHPYRKMLSEAYSTYIAFEGDAEELLTFELAVIPGLLQTEDYARVLNEAGPAELDVDEIEKRVKIRAERQRILEGEDPSVCSP